MNTENYNSLKDAIERNWSELPMDVQKAFDEFNSEREDKERCICGELRPCEHLDPLEDAPVLNENPLARSEQLIQQADDLLSKIRINDLKHEFRMFRIRMNDEPEIHIFSDAFLAEQFVNRCKFRSESLVCPALVAVRLVLAEEKEAAAH